VSIGCTVGVGDGGIKLDGDDSLVGVLDGGLAWPTFPEGEAMAVDPDDTREGAEAEGGADDSELDG
jgi:hypothetical protein